MGSTDLPLRSPRLMGRSLTLLPATPAIHAAANGDLEAAAAAGIVAAGVALASRWRRFDRDVAPEPADATIPVPAPRAWNPQILALGAFASGTVLGATVAVACHRYTYGAASDGTWS